MATIFFKKKKWSSATSNATAAIKFTFIYNSHLQAFGPSALAPAPKVSDSEIQFSENQANFYKKTEEM